MHINQFFVSFLIVLPSLLLISKSAWAETGCPPGTQRVVINFDKLPDGNRTVAGETVSNQWEDIGVTFAGRRRLHRKKNQLEEGDDSVLRLFDSSRPTGGDFDLGSPNKGCTICRGAGGDANVSCPGVATTDPEKAASTNCRNQRNILIIDNGRRRSNDSAKGGEIIISFVVPVPKVLSLSVMDVTREPGVPSTTFTLLDSNEESLLEKPIKGLGDNTWQQQGVQYSGDIGTIKLDVYGSFGLTHLKYCAAQPTEAMRNVPNSEPTKVLSRAPSYQPSLAPTGRPSTQASNSPPDTTTDSPPLKVIVMTGQSNTKGYGRISHLEELINGIPNTPSLDGLLVTSQRLRHLRDGVSGNWTERDDVYITYHSAGSKTSELSRRDRKGQLSAGAGFGATDDFFGPEVGFGWKLGDLLGGGDERIYIIKISWGGASLYGDFRPPSSSINNNFEEPTEGFGWAYNKVVNHVRDTLDNLADIVPNYDPRVGYKLEGLVFFQGYSDIHSRATADEYASNLENLINDFRKDWNEPDLSVVVGEVGMHGRLDPFCPTHSALLCPSDPNCTDIHSDSSALPGYCPGVVRVRYAQRTVAEKMDNVAFAETGIYAYGSIKDPSRPDYRIPYANDQRHHYFQNADTYYYMGESMGEAMYTLLS